MPEATGTTVGTIFLDLQILNSVNKQLTKITSSAQANVGQAMKQTGETVQKAFTQPMERAMEAVNAPLKQVRDQVEQTDREIAEIAARAARRVNSISPEVALPTSVPRIPSAMASQIQRGSDDVNAPSALPGVADVFRPSINAAELLRQKIQNINLQMDAEYRKLGKLNSEFEKLSFGTKAWDDMSAKITASESHLISMQGALNAAQSKMEAMVQKAMESQEESDGLSSRISDAIQEQQDRAAEAMERAAERARNATQATARMQANAFLSAASSQATGIARIGAIGRTALASLRGLATALPMAAVLGALKVLQKGFELASEHSEEFKSNLNALKANLQVAFTPIYQAMLPALNSLVSMLSKAAQAAASFIAGLFGTTYEKALAATKNMQKETGSGSGSGSAKQGTLTSFDQIHTLQKEESNGRSAETGGIDFEALENKANTTAEGFGAKFRAVWDGIAKTFDEMVLQPIRDNLSKFEEPIARFKALWQNIGEQCTQWLKPLVDWFNGDFKTALDNSITNVATILSGLMDTLLTIGNTVWEALGPIIDWLITDGLPMLTDMWMEFSDTVVTVWDYIKTIIDTVWHDVIDPAFKFISNVIVDVMTIFKDLWNKYGAETFENIRKAVENAKQTFLAMWDNVLKPVFDHIFNVLKKLWDEHLKPLVAQIGEFVAKLINGAMEIYNGFVAPLVQWFWETLGPPISAVINTIIDVIADMQACIYDAGQKIFKALGGLVDFIVGGFTGDWTRAWQGIKDFFGGIIDGVFALLGIDKWKEVGRKAIDALTSPFKNIKWPTLKMPKITWTKGAEATGWIANILKAINLPTSLPKLQVQWLARGGIIDQPTLSMIGERGKEAVVPLENNTGWIAQLAQQVAAYIGTGQPLTEDALYRVGRRLISELPAQSATFVATMNNRIIAQEVIKEMKRQNMRYSPVGG